MGRVGLLAVALGIGVAVAGGTAVAGADAPPSNAGDDERPSQSSTQTGDDTATDSTSARLTKRQTEESAGDDDASEEASDDTSGYTDLRSAIDDDPASAPPAALEGVKESEETSSGEEQSFATESRSSRDSGSEAAPLVVLDVVQQPGRESSNTSAASPVETVETPVPSAADQVATEYGDIGKWMLEWTGDIADYGGLPYEGRTVLEPVNVIFVDPTSKSALGATWKLNAAMRRAGFPPRLFHSTGFRGLIDDRRYRQQPRGLLVGYSDDFFLVDNNHGRIFGPDPIETSSGFVWSGAFSTEELVWAGGLPRHAYVSSNMARDALVADLVASGRAKLGGTVSLANAYNTDTTTTGDHDGHAVVVILNQLNIFGVPINAGGESLGNRTCVTAGVTTASASAPCVTITIDTRSGSG